MITEDEIGRELVLFLDPDVLEAAGATYTCSKPFRVVGGHYFLCIYADEEDGRWLPLYSAMGQGRKPLSMDGREGHPHWVEHPAHWHHRQVWWIKHSAVPAAADAAGDWSTAARRNKLHEDYFPTLPT